LKLLHTHSDVTIDNGVYIDQAHFLTESDLCNNILEFETPCVEYALYERNTLLFDVTTKWAFSILYTSKSEDSNAEHTKAKLLFSCFVFCSDV
jgi:hypothetical protein